MQAPTRMTILTMKKHLYQHDPLRLHADDPDARSQIASAVDAVLTDGAPYRLQVRLDGQRLAAETIAGLVTGLRRLREHGGAIEVTTAEGPVRDAFVLAGLERVFAFPLAPADEPRRSLL